MHKQKITKFVCLQSVKERNYTVYNYNLLIHDAKQIQTKVFREYKLEFKAKKVQNCNQISQIQVAFHKQ